MPPARKPLDVAALNALTEPLTVRVERVNGATREPISLPDAPNADYSIENPPEVYTVASGWTIDQVRALETWILGWTGGGNYSVSVTDGNNQTLEWYFNYNTREHKPRPSPSASAPAVPQQQMSMGIQPPPSAIAHAAAQGIPVQMSQQPMLVPVPMNDQQHGGLPPASAYGQQLQPFYQQPQVPMYFQQTPLPQRLPGNATPDQRLEYENRMYREQAAQAQAQLMAREAETRIAAAQAQAREEMRQRDVQHEREMQMLREQVTAAMAPKTDLRSEIGGAIASALAPIIESLKPKEDNALQRAIDEMRRQQDERDRNHAAEIQRLRDEQARKDADAQRERDRLENERREEKLRSEMKDQATRFERLVEQMRDSQKSTGPDPMLMLMQQIMTTQADAMKQVASQQTMATQQLAQFMMPPAQMVAMMRDSAGGSEQMFRQISDAYAGVMAAMSQAMGIVQQNQGGGGNPIVETVQKLTEKAGELGDKWLETQQTGMIQQAKTAQAQVNAQAQVLTAQAQAQQPVIIQQPQAPAPQLPPAPSVAQPASTPTAPMQTAGANTTGADGMPTAAIKRHGRTDVEWFGPTLPDVENLRLGAAAFAESIEMKPIRKDDKGAIVGISPAQAARYLTAAAAQIISAKADIPAFTKLFLQDLHADLMDVLLPNVVQDYRDLCVKFLTKQLDPRVEADMFTDAAAAGEEEDDEEPEEPSEEEIRESDGGAIPIARALPPKKPKPGTAPSPH